MKKILFVLLLTTSIINGFSQRLYRFNDSGKTATKEFELIHTKIKLDFDFTKQTANGEVWIKLKPFVLPTQKLILDAKKMNVFDVKVNQKNATFYNSGNHINIDLDKLYTFKDTLTIYVKYKSNPSEIINDGGKAITDNKGLYFINPEGRDAKKPIQIWTQGEPERNSVWFPTIDKPNQKSTEEIILTVPNQYITLSNGLMYKQTNNSDGTRTDYWKQDLPHAPYLFFVGVGGFKKISHQWKGKEVSYYVEPAYENTAPELFKNTDKMLEFFSNITGVPYPWDKYSQMIVRDYVSGAMENTTAVIHAEQAMQSLGELKERNNWERVIAHEMFHHWFGDLVTTESWANITVNESFANYSEYLWLQHEYGNDRADEHLQNDREGYFRGDNYSKYLVRYVHDKHDDMFDAVSYNKGGLILHMLRNYLGDEVFFKGLHIYLTQNKFKSAEATQLRLALEEASGQDLMWFFSQWYYSNGHPKLKVSQNYNNQTSNLEVTIYQTEKQFDFPLTIDIYMGKEKLRNQVFVTKETETFSFHLKSNPNLVVVNADHVLLAEISNTTVKNTEDYIFQYQYCKHFEERMEALEQLKDLQNQKNVFEVYNKAINDPYEVIQAYALKNINLSKIHTKKKTIENILRLVNCGNYMVEAAAVEVLGKIANPDYVTIFKIKINSISPSVKGEALLGLYYINKKEALAIADKMNDDDKEVLFAPLIKMYLEEKPVSQITFVAKYLLTGMYFINDENLKAKFEDAFKWVASTNNTEAIQIMVTDFVEKGNKYKQYNFNYKCINHLREVIQIQKNNKLSNKDKNIKIIENGIYELAN